MWILAPSRLRGAWPGREPSTLMEAEQWPVGRPKNDVKIVMAHHWQAKSGCVMCSSHAWMACDVTWGAVGALALQRHCRPQCRCWQGQPVPSTCRALRP
jgi:hypothetical protein